MKKVLLAAMVLLAGASFTSCSSSDDDGGENPGTEQQKPNYKIHDNNIVGVWRGGNYYFASFSSDKHNASLISKQVP